ncbi:peptide chain release factor N(5)-glutamine methyltransferase [soil metagenome]
MKTPTISEALNVSQVPVSFREAEVLLAHVLSCTRERLHTYPEQVLTENQYGEYQNFLERRQRNEPVAYITGVKEFYGRPFKCDPRALIPRPETEGVIDLAIPFLTKRFKDLSAATNKPCPVYVLELGTGAGNIGVTLSLELQKANVPATLIITDVSPEALALAEENYATLNPKPSPHLVVHFLQADLFAHQKISDKTFSLITANLPYIAPAWRMNPDAQPDVLFHEPDVALFGGDEDGLGLYRSFFAEAPKHLEKGGKVVIEYGEDQTLALKPLAEAAFPGASIVVHQDYAGLDRILEITPL